MRKRTKRAGLEIPASASVNEIMQALVQPRTTMETPPPQRIPNRIVQDPGVRCVHCGHRFDHKVTHTYTNGRRRVHCGGCGKPFITARITA